MERLFTEVTAPSSTPRSEVFYHSAPTDRLEGCSCRAYRVWGLEDIVAVSQHGRPSWPRLEPSPC